MLEAKAFTEPHVLWIVGKCDLDAYRDRWYQTNIIYSSNYLILNSVFNSDGMPVEESFRNLLGHEALEEGINKNISVTNIEDLFVWDQSYLGFFSLSSTSSLIRKRGFIT